MSEKPHTRSTNTSPIWQCAHSRTISLDCPRVMGILNTTPDSFSDGGRFLNAEHAVGHAMEMLSHGATIIDIGGESTRPGAARVSDHEQIDRVVPVIEVLSKAANASDITLSVDTTSSIVARKAIDAGAHIINDVSGGTDDPEILNVAADTGAGIVLMHRLCEPDKDSYSDQYTVPPIYNNVVTDVRDALAKMVSRALGAGVGRECIVVDPGLGFGKTVEQNLALIEGTPLIAQLGQPVLSGLSRKSFVGSVSTALSDAKDPAPLEPEDRLAGTIALTIFHAIRGASIFRVHDVEPATRALGAIHAANTKPQVG